MKYFIGFTVGLIIGLLSAPEARVIETIQVNGTLWCLPDNSKDNDYSRKLFHTTKTGTEVLIPCDE